MRTADDDSVPVSYDAFKLPHPVRNWKPRPARVVVWRPRRDELEPDDTEVSRVDSLSGSRTSTRAASDEPDDEPTMALQMPILPRAPERTDTRQELLAGGAAHLDAALARAAKLWRDGPLRTAAMMGAAVLVTYLALAGVRRDSHERTRTVLVPTAALPVAAPIIVEQLNGARQLGETTVAAPPPGDQSDRPARKSARVTSVATTPVSKSHGHRAIAPAKPKSSRAERSSATVPSSSAGLPAWGAEALRDFSDGKNSTRASVTSHSQALTAKPAPSNADVQPPMAGYLASAREQPKAAPVVAAKPAEPPKQVAPARPSKPLTMDQVLNQVEEAAQAQRKQAGLKAPKTSKQDAELDELINGAMKSKAK